MIYYKHTKGIKMNLFSEQQQPILNVLKRIYRHNGQWVQTTQQYKKRVRK